MSLKSFHNSVGGYQLPRELSIPVEVLRNAIARNARQLSIQETVLSNDYEQSQCTYENYSETEMNPHGFASHVTFNPNLKFSL